MNPPSSEMLTSQHRIQCLQEFTFAHNTSSAAIQILRNLTSLHLVGWLLHWHAQPYAVASSDGAAADFFDARSCCSASWRRSELRAQWAAFWPLMNIAPNVGPMRGQPSSSATCNPSLSVDIICHRKRVSKNEVHALHGNNSVQGGFQWL